MSSASRTGSEGLKGTRNLRTMAKDSQPASSDVARFQIHSDTELEADFSGLKYEEDQRMIQSAAAGSSGVQLAPQAGPVVFGPDAPDPLYQQTAADSRSIDFFQAGTSEEAANSLAEARARHVVAQAQACVASNTATAERQVSLARAEAAQIAVSSQRAISSAREEPVAAASRADATRATAHSEVASLAARAEQRAAQIQSETTAAAVPATTAAAASARAASKQRTALPTRGLPHHYHHQYGSA